MKLSLLDELRCDAKRYEELGGWKTHAGFWAGATYRYGHRVRQLPAPLQAPAMVPYKLANAVFRLLFHVTIAADAKIGEGLCLIHPTNILIGESVIGRNCLVFHDVTLGTNANSDDAFPRVGDNVDLYVGARVLGRVEVGSGARIGANCVITSNVPDGCTVVSAANRVVPAAAVAVFGARKKSAP